MENFDGLTPEEEARLLELDKRVEFDKTKPENQKDFINL